MAQNGTNGRIDWVDYSKGICIILVVLMHSTLGVETAMGTESWLHRFIEWARPFRMPDFFLIAGLFLARRIDRPWRSYLDTKVVHFAYFYIMWMSVWYILKLPQFIAETGLKDALLLYPLSFVQPLGTLWFIYMLAVFFVVAKLVKDAPVLLIWGGAAILHAMNLETGARVIDEFAARFVFFYSGFVFAPVVFSVARFFNRQTMTTLFSVMTIWAVINGWFVFNGLATMPVISLVLGYIGTSAVIGAGVILSRLKLAAPVRYAGANSIVIFLSYFIFMAVSRILILKTGLITDAGILSLVVTAAGTIGPILTFWMVRNTPAAFIYRRPEALSLGEPENHPRQRAEEI